MQPSPLSNNNLTSYRNVGILCGYVIFFFITYISAAEYAKPPKSEGEVLVFRRCKMPADLSQKVETDEESQSPEDAVTERVTTTPAEKATENRPRPSACGKPILHWENICYDVKIKGQDRRILDYVDGWVQPGVITALMVRLLLFTLGRILTCMCRAHPVLERPPFLMLLQLE